MRKINLTKRYREKLPLVFGLVFIWAAAFFNPSVKAAKSGEKLEITANFTGREILPNEKIELKLSRTLRSTEGRLAVVIGETDFSGLFAVGPEGLSYTPQIILLPAGESILTVYLVEPAGGEWRALAEFSLRVKAVVESQPETSPVQDENADGWKIEFTPNVSLNIKGQNQVLTFPREAEPERNPFNDLDGQGNVELKISNRGWTFASRFDLVGVSFRQNALRFGELQDRAPVIDLSGYLLELGKGRFSVRMGHVSFGSNRHLINSFSSRGITVNIPVGRQNEISLAAMNGTSIVGFDNFTGVTRRRHSVLSAVFAREFFKERPNGLRFEFSLIRGSLLPVTNFNQGEVNDAEKSSGYGFKVGGSDAGQRLRFEGGFTRSRFTNPSDPFLDQGFDLTAIRPVWRNARYGEISFDFLRGLKLWNEKKLKLTGTFRHEEIQPLFRSVAAFTQADRRQNQFEISGNFGELNFAFGNLRDRDNLNNIASILITLNRRQNAIFGIPLNSFFTPSKPVRWLPQISYNYDHVHNFGLFLPVDGDFRDLSQVPDQDSFNHVFNANWHLTDKFSIGYRYNRAFQDNKQPGRETADFQSAVNALSFGIKPLGSLDLNFDLSAERQKNFEQPRIDRLFRFGSQVNWRVPHLKNLTLNANFSASLAGDAANTTDSRNAEFDVQTAYRFEFGKEKFKKMQMQMFIRYANRYGDVRDRLFFVHNFNKTQTFNAGLTFNFF